MAWPQGAAMRSAVLPQARAMACQRSEKAPQVRWSTSDRTVDTTALSITSVELPVAIITSPAVRKIRGNRSATRR